MQNACFRLFAELCPDLAIRRKSYFYSSLFEGEVLWVKNKDLANYLIDFLGAKHRKRPYNGLYHFLTRLPGWMLKADKEKIVKALQKYLV